MVGMNERLSFCQLPKNILRDTVSGIHRDRNHLASQAAPLFQRFKKKKIKSRKFNSFILSTPC